MQLGQEPFQAVGEFQAGVAVSKLGVHGVELAAHGRLAGAQVRHPGSQFVDGDELFGERLDHAGDRGVGLGRGGGKRARARVAGSAVRAA